MSIAETFRRVTIIGQQLVLNWLEVIIVTISNYCHLLVTVYTIRKDHAGLKQFGVLLHT